MSISFYIQVYHQINLQKNQARLLSFLAGPINHRKFIATRPEGTRQPDF